MWYNVRQMNILCIIAMAASGVFRLGDISEVVYDESFETDAAKRRIGLENRAWFGGQ